MIYGRVEIVDSLMTIRDAGTLRGLEEQFSVRVHNPLSNLGIKGFMETIVDTSLSSGCRSLMQLSGVRYVAGGVSGSFVSSFLA